MRSSFISNKYRLEIYPESRIVELETQHTRFIQYNLTFELFYVSQEYFPTRKTSVVSQTGKLKHFEKNDDNNTLDLDI